MRSNKELLNDCRLYLILDTAVQPYPKLFDIAKESIQAGVDILQIRDKAGKPKEILEFAKKIFRLTQRRIPLIINDRVDLVLASHASGVHLGQEDISLKSAQGILKNGIVGISCQAFDHALQAQKEGADYIGFGSVFKTLTKPERQPMELKLLQDVFSHIKIPIFAIGGIGLENISHLITLGVRRIAVCRAICETNNVKKTVRQFKRILRE